MPTISKSACRCGGTRTDGVCDRCGVVRGKHAKTTTERGYGGDWAKLSKRIRKERPLCEPCWREGRVRSATEVHHIVSIARAPHLRLDANNLMSVCRECHEQLEKRQQPVR